MRPMRLNAAGEKLIKEYEKLELVGYLCPSGIPTAGWGHTGPDVKVGKGYTREKAVTWWLDDKAKFERGVSECIDAPTNENQFAAMCSLAYNIGLGSKKASGQQGFRQSTVLRLHNEGDHIGASRAFARWNKGRNAKGELVELRGLTRRRAAEATLYMTPTAEEEEADPQRTRSPVVEPSEPSTAAGMSTTMKVAATAVPPAVIVAKEAVVQVNDVWSWLAENGIDPHIASAVMAAVASLAVIYVGWRVWKLLRATA